MNNFLKDSAKLKELQTLLIDLYKFITEQLSFSPGILIILKHDGQNASNPLGNTGYFDVGNKKIILYTTDRHIKDILRTFAHEMYHVFQNYDGKLTGEEKTYSSKYFQEDPHLRELEKEAYEKGNILFRTWTENKSGKEK